MGFNTLGVTLRKFMLGVGLAALVWVFVVPSCSDGFGCAAAGSQTTLADASDCPENLQEAAQDSEWAAERMRTIADDGITTGLLYDEDGNEERITSGRGGAYGSVLAYLQPYGGSLLRDRPPGSQVAEHVEAKAAAVLRDAEQTNGVLVINNPDGPCGYASGIGCIAAVELILRSGATMDVWWPQGHQRYTGRAA